MGSGVRIGGLSSGMDTESLVKGLMDSEKVKYNKFYQNKQKLSWKREAYNSINKEFASFINSSSKSFGITRNSYGEIYDSSKNSMSWIKESSVGDSTITKVTAGASTPSGKYQVTVDELATGIKINGKVSDGAIFDTDKKTKALGSFTICTGDMVAPETINYSANESITSIVSKINSLTFKNASGSSQSAGLLAYYDEKSSSIMISSKATGNDVMLKMTGALISDLGLKTSDGNAVDFLPGGPANEDAQGFLCGKNSKITIDGVQLTSSTNQITFNGMSITGLKQGTTDINIAVNVDSAIKKIVEFVDNYNKVIDTINKKSREKVYREYQPLLEEQKKDMKDDDIKLWEEKSKSGLLKSDDLLTSVSGNIRAWLYEKVEGATGKYKSIFEVGIETTSNFKEPGKLTIDESKLKTALGEDPDSVIDLLFKNGGSSKPESDMSKSEIDIKRKNSGLVNRLYDEMILGMKKIITKSGAGDDPSLLRSVQATIFLEFTIKGAYGKGNESYLDRDIDQTEKMMLNEDKRLKSRETMYWNRFTAMEKAISKMNSQSSWIASQLGAK